MTRPLGTELRNACNGLVSSVRPVASIVRGTTTTSVGAVPRRPAFGLRGPAVPGEVEFPTGDERPGRRADDPFDEPPHATPSNSIATTAATSQKRLQGRNQRVDSIVMEAPQFYRDAHVSPDAPTRESRADLEARLAELERVVAALTERHKERGVDRRAGRPDPVAITRALHPRGMRRTKNTTRGSTGNGTIAMRAVLFEPPSSR
jgi:hypothetical protein